MPTLPFTSGDIVAEAQKMVGKISISGVQPKLSVHLNKKRKVLEVVEGGGSFILKPQVERFSHLPENENLCMTIAEGLKIDTPPHGLLRFQDGSLCYVIKRFDRLDYGTKLPQEDFQQLTGIYDKYSGSMERVGKVLLEYSSAPLLDAVILFERLLLFFVLGNGDAHLKNFSLLKKPELGYRLSPVYDIVNSRLALPLEQEEMSLSINGKRNKLKLEDFLSFAAYMEIPDKTVSTVLNRLNKSKGAIKSQIDSSRLPQEERNRFWSICEERLLRFFIFPLFFLLSLIYPFNSFAQSNWHLTPSLTVSETYDDNIYSTTTGVDDYITKIGANLSATYNGSNIGLQGNYLLNLNTFARRPKGNVVTQDGGFNIDLNRWFRKLFQKSEVAITEDFTFTPDIKDYYFNDVRGKIDPLSNYGVRTRRSDGFRNALGIDVLLPIANRVSLSPSYSNLLTVYKDPSFKDSIINTVGLGVRYSFPRDVVYSTVNTGNIRVVRGTTEVSNSYVLLIGVRHSISPLSAFDINAGVSILDHEEGDRDSTFNGGFSLTKRQKIHTYNMGYLRTLNTISSISDRPTIAEILYINITNIHSKDLTSSISADYAINSSIRGDKEEVDTHSYNLSGRLNYTIRKWLSFSITASHFNQESDRLTVEAMKRNLLTTALEGIWN